MDVYVKRKKIPLKPSKSIGKGGEADVYDIGNGKALKVFKPPEHADYQNMPQEQQAARDRLAEHQIKLRHFPKNLPSRVIQPEELATDSLGQIIRGYTMPLIKDADVLMKYSDRTFRQTGITNQPVVKIFQDLYQTVDSIHQAGVTIGDFNDLNILVLGTEAYIIDADSFQYGGFLCKMFTARFVDPLLCDSHASQPILQQPHAPSSDWYAFAIMLMQSLLFVDPYGGVYRPKDPSKRIPHNARPLQRITVFHPEVKYPKPAVPYNVLPDDLLHYFHQIFEKDIRGKFPQSLLDKLYWKKCPNCSIEHARQSCPNCTLSVAVPSIVLRQVIRGSVTATPIFTTEGVILFATIQSGQLQWIYHERGEFKREDGSTILSGQPDPQVQFRIQVKSTLIGKQGQIITLSPGQSPNRIAIETFDTNEFSRYWTYNGQLLRDGYLGAEYIGDVLAGQTQFWVGAQFGFGFYRAGNLNVAFVFDAKRKGINDRVQLPPYSGQLIDAIAFFSNDRCWFLQTNRYRGKTINRCALIHPDGTVEATAQTEAGDNSWLSTIHGKCAAAHFLLVATDEGIVRIEAHNNQIIQTKEFPDTEPFVNSNSQILASDRGLYIVNHQQIHLLKIT